VVVMAVMAMVNDNHNLRLRRIGNCEAEDEYESKQNLFHSSQYRAAQIDLQSYCDHCAQTPDTVPSNA
jgi:hypothetical protein